MLHRRDFLKLSAAAAAAQALPSRAATLPLLLPTENMCCASALLEFGKFRYYTGGDLNIAATFGPYAS